MNTSIPLGSRETQTLEFKGREALAKPARLAREVVAFLNASGGTLWVGLREENGIAVEVEPVPDAETAKRRLLDALLDTIEPPVGSEQVEIQVESDADGQELLRVNVQTRSATVFHVRGGGGQGRRFYVRVDDRIRHLTWGEIVERVRDSDATQQERQLPLEQAREQVLAERAAFLRRKPGAMWLRIKPVEKLRFDLSSPALRALLTDASASSNRSVGWNPINPYSQPRKLQGRIVLDSASIHQDGSLTLEVKLEALHWQGDDRELYPYALLEYPVSMFRIAAAMYRTQPDPQYKGQFVCDLAIAGLAGWKLRPYSPRSMGYSRLSPASLQGEFTLLDPLTCSRDAIVERPDACARPLLAEFYDFAGFTNVAHDEDPMPFEFDAQTGKLELDS